MHEADVFVLADRALNDIVQQIKDDQWSMIMPPSFSTSGDGKQVSLYQVITYHAYDDAWVPDMLAGRSMDEVGRTKYDGNILGDQPREKFDEFVARACQAAIDFKDLEQTVHCSFGDFPAREYLWQVIAFRSLRVCDIAQVTGTMPEMSDALVRALWQGLGARAEQWRSYGVFGPAVMVDPNASLLDKLLGLTGRQPLGDFSYSPEAEAALLEAIDGANERMARNAFMQAQAASLNAAAPETTPNAAAAGAAAPAVPQPAVDPYRATMAAVPAVPAAPPQPDVNPDEPTEVYNRNPLARQYEAAPPQNDRPDGGPFPPAGPGAGAAGL